MASNDNHTGEDAEISTDTPGETSAQSSEGRSVSAAADDDAEQRGLTDTETDPLLAAYRHDVHKLRCRSHDAAVETAYGVRVNESVPCHADRDAALLSRPPGEPEQTVENHCSHYRRSLLSGRKRQPGWEETDVGLTIESIDSDVDEVIEALVTIEDPAAMHRAWLDASLPGDFNESLYYPYTSLKYHTLLAGALLSNYLEGAGFEELYLAVDPPGDAEIVPHRTILSGKQCNLRVTTSPGGAPAASLGATPTRCWADVWSRLPAHPFETDGNRPGMILDAQLRRLRSWSVALQYIDDWTAKWGEQL